MFNTIRMAIILVLATLLLNCSTPGSGGSPGSSSGSNCSISSNGGKGNKVISPSHNQTFGGTLHANGGKSALSNCVACHGSSLEGNAGYTLVSSNVVGGGGDLVLSPPCCTNCHSKKW